MGVLSRDWVLSFYPGRRLRDPEPTHLSCVCLGEHTKLPEHGPITLYRDLLSIHGGIFLGWEHLYSVGSGRWVGSQWLGNGNSIGHGNLWDLPGQPRLWPQTYKMGAHLGALDKAGDLQALAV